MPELAEVEVVRQNLAQWWEHKQADEVIVLDPRALLKTEETALRDAITQPLQRIERRAKYLIAHMADGQAIVFHFRMTGKIIRAQDCTVKYARLCWHIPHEGWLVFKDQRRFGHVQCYAPGGLDKDPALAKLGPEPYDLDLATFKAQLSPRRLLKASLLDQKVVAGIGNIAVSELFWRTKLSPTAKVNMLSDDQLEALMDEMPRYFDEVIAKSQGDEIVYLEEGGSDEAFDVYGREGKPCPRCQTPIERIVVSGRSSFFCPQCQGI